MIAGYQWVICKRLPISYPHERSHGYANTSGPQPLDEPATEYHTLLGAEWTSLPISFYWQRDSSQDIWSHFRS